MRGPRSVEHRLLAGDLCQIARRSVDDLLVGDRLAHAHVHRDLDDLRHFHRVGDAKLLAELRNDLLAVIFLQPCHAG